MAKTYRVAQHWNQWLSQPFGRSIQAYEYLYLQKLWTDMYGKHGLLIGVSQQIDLIHTSETACHVLLSPLFNKELPILAVESDFHELPILSGAVDLVLLPHTLDYTDNPRQLLAESCRIVKPEGHIIILGFNRISLWGLRKLLSTSRQIPWTLHFFQTATIKKWLQLADFELVKQETILFSLPFHSKRKLKWLEWIGRKFFKPFGSVYIVVAKAKVIPLTPIRLTWQQKLSSVHVTIPGPTMRDF